MTVVPLLLFVGIEMGLRLAGYGYSPNYFIKASEGNGYRSNQKFGWRFFSPHLARFPLPLSLPKDKSAGTYRIFVLGGSAARGEPDYSFSFSRILGKMLSNNYPQREFEIINTAMVAINSHVVYQIAKECAKLKPDLFIVYLGNNEVVGPFGSGTVFRSYSPNLTMIRAGIWANSLRLGQLLNSLIQNVFKKEQNIKVWRGMEMFLENQVPFDDPRLQKVYAHFERNLTDIISIAGDSGAKVIISTVATNLKDNAPFASMHRQGLSEVQKADWERSYKAGIELAADGRFGEAVNSYLQAVQIDGDYADLHFLQARCYMKLNKYKEANKCYIKARDMDVLRFRADTQINRIIREKASGRESEDVYLVDAERCFAESERIPHEIPGEELFYEHVHMNFFGNYLLAKAVFLQVSSILSKDIRSSTSKEIPILSTERCADLLAFTDRDLSKILARILERVTRPPFTNQINNEQGQKKIVERMKRVKTHLTPADLDLVEQNYRMALENSQDDWILHDNFAEFNKERGNYEEALAHWRIALEIVPDYADLNNNLGVLLSYKGKFDEAINYFSEALRINPYLIEAHTNLGLVLNKIGKKDEANKHFSQAERLRPSIR
jgi:tetratricopeptide (TPR) repeat protein